MVMQKNHRRHREKEISPRGPKQAKKKPAEKKIAPANAAAQ
jgi:hypothetical protein